MCCLNYTENELHFVFFCPFYCEQRNALFSKIKTDIDFVNIDDANLSTDSLLYIHLLLQTYFTNKDSQTKVHKLHKLTPFFEF